MGPKQRTPVSLGTIEAIPFMKGSVALGAAMLSCIATIAPAYADSSAYSWTGPYIGVQGGYSWAHAAQTYDDTNVPATINPMSPTGWGGGFEGGVNYQFASGLVIGAEADVTFANITDTIPDNLANMTAGPDQTVTATTDLAYNLRGRLGFAVGRTLIYGAAGYAGAHATVKSSYGNLSDEGTLSGWTAGGGLEQALTQNVSARIEYLYTHHGDHTWYAGAPYAATGDDDTSTVRAGLNLHF
jgi:outer membrane immunogenic protein